MRGTDMPVCHFEREKLAKGEYLIFYRVAFSHGDAARQTDPSCIGGNKGRMYETVRRYETMKKGAAAASRDMDEPEHPERKIVLTLAFP